MEKKNLFLGVSPFIFYYLYKFRFSFLGKKFRYRQFNKNMILRLKDKYILNNSDGNYLGIVYPTNIFDVQKIFEYANIYKIPLIRDVNYNRIYFPYKHCIIDMSKYSDILKFNLKAKRIRVQSGISVDKLLDFLNKHNYTIKLLEKYLGRNLTINDLFFNNFYGSKLQNDCLRYYSIIIPKEEKIVKFNPFTDFSGNHINISNLFLNNSYILSLLLETEFLYTEKEYYNFFSFNIHQNDNSILDKLKEEQIIDDMIITYIGDSNKFGKKKVLIKVKENNSNKLLGILDYYGLINVQKENIKINEIFLNKNTNNKYSRHIKIVIDKQYLKFFVNYFEKKYNKIFENKFTLPEIKYSQKENVFFISLPYFEDIPNIEKQYIFIKELNKIINKINGNFFLNQNINIPNRFDQMREIGLNNFIMHQDIKQYFDPNYILNPHLCNIKPNFFSLLKRKNRFINYIFTKMKI